MRIVSIVTALLAFVLPSHATPILTNIGVNGSLLIGDCAMTASGSCRATGDFQIGNSVLSPSFGAFGVSDMLRASANAFGQSSGTSYLPELHAYASSNGAYSPPASHQQPGDTGVMSSFADANIWGVQGYLYTGLSPFNLSVTISAHSVFSADYVGHSIFSASIFDANGYSFSYGDFEFCPMYRRCAFTDPNLNITPFDYVEGILFNSGVQTLTLNHTVNSGDRFYVGAFLDANVCCGQTVDSSHTLNMAFNDFSQLDSLPVPGVVPEPGSTLLILMGLGLVWRQSKTSKGLNEPNIAWNISKAA
jgi:hypothetical protein